MPIQNPLNEEKDLLGRTETKKRKRLLSGSSVFYEPPTEDGKVVKKLKCV